MAEQHILKVEHLEVRAGSKAILQDVSLTLGQGELVVLLGPNGAGKSSLVRAVAGEQSPHQGRIHIAGRCLSTWQRRALARHRAVMPQRVDVNFPFTAREVVALGCPAAPRARTDALIGELLARLEVADLADRLIMTLSGGERQRVQLARVLAQLWHSPGPRLLLLDECTAALDPAHQLLVFALLRELASSRGYGILAVVHDLNLAAAHADRLLVMQHGRMVAEGPAARVLEPALLERVYGLRARVTQLPEGYPMVIPLPREPTPGASADLRVVAGGH